MILLYFSHQWRLTYGAYEAVALLSRKLGTFVIIILQLFLHRAYRGMVH